MNFIHQISIFLENRKGSLSEVTTSLAASGINLRALSIAESADYGVLRIIADDTEKATSTLLEKGFILSKTPVTVITVPDEPAGLSRVLALLSDGGVDIEYMYSLFTHQEGKAYMVFRTQNPEDFEALIASHNLSVASAAELGLK